MRLFANILERENSCFMPTLFRFLTVIAILVALAYGAMFALATFVQPRTGEISVRVPAQKLNPPDE